MNFPIPPKLKISALLGSLGLFLGCQSGSLSAQQGPPTVAAPASALNAPTNVVSGTAQPPVPVVAEAAPPVALSEGVAEIIQMAQSGVGDDVLIAFIERSPILYRLSADEIVYLTDLGLSEEVITALLKHGSAAPQPSPGPPDAAAPAPAPPPAPQPPAAQAAAPTTPSVSVTATPEFEAAATAPQPGQVVTAAPVYVQPTQVYYTTDFYAALSPYGSWVEVPSFGMCWRPTVAVIDSGWRPYSHRGRWLYTDYGWYWHSDYTWGWAPFHYGRWYSHTGFGWVWVPDTTWGPAWVTWRYSPAYCGWAPLPPGAYYQSGFGLRYYSAGVGISFDFGLRSDCYTYVPFHRFHDRHPWRHRLPHHQVVNIHNETTIINNYIQGPQNRIINQGIAKDQVSRLSRSEIRKVNVQEMPTTPGRTIRPDRLEREGSELVVYKPPTPAARSAPARSPQRVPSAVSSISKTEIDSRRQRALETGVEPTRARPVARTGPSTGLPRPIRSGLSSEATPSERPPLRSPQTATTEPGGSRVATTPVIPKLAVEGRESRRISAEAGRVPIQSSPRTPDGGPGSPGTSERIAPMRAAPTTPSTGTAISGSRQPAVSTPQPVGRTPLAPGEVGVGRTPPSTAPVRRTAPPRATGLTPLPGDPKPVENRGTSLNSLQLSRPISPAPARIVPSAPVQAPSMANPAVNQGPMNRRLPTPPTGAGVNQFSQPYSAPATRSEIPKSPVIPAQRQQWAPAPAPVPSRGISPGYPQPVRTPPSAPTRVAPHRVAPSHGTPIQIEPRQPAPQPTYAPQPATRAPASQGHISSERNNNASGAPPRPAAAQPSSRSGSSRQEYRR